MTAALAAVATSVLLFVDVVVVMLLEAGVVSSSRACWKQATQQQQ